MTSSVARILARLVCCLVMLASCIACTPAPPTGIVEVEPPRGLAELDATVQEQFESTWKSLHEEHASGRALGVAWGRMGQWFDVYRYDDSAEKCYANARLLDPEEGRWPYYQGIIAVERGDVDLAIERFAEAADLAPSVPGPRVQLGDLALVQEKSDAAESHYRKALLLDADNPSAQFGIGRIALQRGDPDAAREVFERLLEQQPNASKVQYSLGLTWRQLGDRKRAAEFMSRVPEANEDQVRLATRDPWINELSTFDLGAVALTRRAVQVAHRGQHDVAVLLFGQAVIADPLGPDKRINYAKALTKIGQTNGAIEQLGKALDLSKEQPEPASRAHLALAALYSSQGQLKPAETHLLEALDNDPESVEARIQLGRLRQSQANHEGALAEYAAVRDMSSAGTEVCFWHAALLVILDRPEDARKAIEEDLSRFGDDGHLRRLLSRVLVTMPDAGPLDIARARELLGDEKEPDVFFAETLSMIAAAEGRFGEAEAWQNAAIDALDRDRDRLAAHIARRRLVLYRQQQTCLNPWEVTERVVFRKVTEPSSQLQGIQ